MTLLSSSLYTSPNLLLKPPTPLEIQPAFWNQEDPTQIRGNAHHQNPKPQLGWNPPAQRPSRPAKVQLLAWTESLNRILWSEGQRENRNQGEKTAIHHRNWNVDYNHYESRCLSISVRTQSTQQGQYIMTIAHPNHYSKPWIYSTAVQENDLKAKTMKIIKGLKEEMKTIY